VQRRDVARREAEQLYYATSQTVANYLWDDAQSPLDLAPGRRAHGARARGRARRLDAPAGVARAGARGSTRSCAGSGRRCDQAAAQPAASPMQQVCRSPSCRSTRWRPATSSRALTNARRSIATTLVGGTVRTPLPVHARARALHAPTSGLESRQLEQTRVRREVRSKCGRLPTTSRRCSPVLELPREARCASPAPASTGRAAAVRGGRELSWLIVQPALSGCSSTGAQARRHRGQVRLDAAELAVAHRRAGGAPARGRRAR
jgi:hypothetical protein